MITMIIAIVVPEGDGPGSGWCSRSRWPTWARQGWQAAPAAEHLAPDQRIKTNNKCVYVYIYT